MTTDPDMLGKCAQIVVNARHIVCFTGAGMSAESGIGTFRGGSGLWSGALGYIVLGWFGTPIGWKWTPGFAWSQYIDKFYNPIRDAQPNEGHRALVRLQEMYPEMSIITQNVDGLHQMAGSNPDQVFEVHGTVKRSRCISNGHIYDFEGETNLPRKSPTCRVEECASTLRPDCVLFTESLPRDQWINAELATRKLGSGDVMIIVGTSAQVYPAAGLPELATERGATLIDVNLERTNFSSLKNYEYLGGTAATTLPALVKRVQQLKKTANIKPVEDLEHSLKSFSQ
jgi:NAD-dependent deacetylase